MANPDKEMSELNGTLDQRSQQTIINYSIQQLQIHSLLSGTWKTLHIQLIVGHKNKHQQIKTEITSSLILTTAAYNQKAAIETLGILNRCETTRSRKTPGTAWVCTQGRVHARVKTTVRSQLPPFTVGSGHQTQAGRLDCKHLTAEPF